VQPAPAIERDSERLAALLARADVRLVIDSSAAARLAGQAAARGGTTAGCIWEVDCGARRCGTEPGPPTITALSEAMATPNVAFDGLMTFPGHVYRSRDRTEVAAAVADEQEAIAATLAAAPSGEIAAETISGGTTPTAWSTQARGQLTELRPGNYVFHDATQVAIGVSRSRSGAR
jgi:D-serine deaminase-like pyridoxal phosphate-dependent protein